MYGPQIHRDIKPDNILASPSPSGMGHIVKLTDFGSAREVGGETAVAPRSNSRNHLGHSHDTGGDARSKEMDLTYYVGSRW